MSALIFLVTPVELLFVEHFESPKQFIPFTLCASGLIVVAAVLWRAERATILLLRGTMVAVALGSLLGMYFHIATNVAFELEIRPAATLLQVLPKALGGASPLLAPGILALAALLALAATYYHPALQGRARTSTA